jgi:apolipoprotein N-acyltransferase
MASTVGISAFAEHTGATSGETRFNTPAVILAELHLGGARTLATRLGAIPEYSIVAVALAGLAAARARRRHRDFRSDDESGSIDSETTHNAAPGIKEDL